jgi:hypothetical protein
MNPAIITALNERPLISRVMVNCANRLGVKVYASVHNDKDKDVLHTYSNDYEVISHEVNDMALKFNSALEAAYNNGHTHFIVLGDDDSVSGKVLTDIDHGGFTRNHFIDTLSGGVGLNDYSKQYPYAKVIGAGRVVSRKAIEDAAHCTMVEVRRSHSDGYCIFNVGDTLRMRYSTARVFEMMGVVKIKHHEFIGLWPVKTQRGMDWRADYRLLRSGYAPTLLDDERVHVSDIKSDVNVWRFDILKKDLTESTIADATWFMGEEEKEYVLSLIKHK